MPIIFIRTLTGDVFPVEVESDDTVEELKNKVIKAVPEFIDPLRQKWELIFRGKPLMDHFVLSDVHIGAHSSIHAISYLKSLEERYDTLIAAINAREQEVPAKIFGIQLHTSKINIYCENEEIGNEFGKKYFDAIDMQVFAVAPPNFLNQCTLCLNPSCRSVTGGVEDTGSTNWIGNGSQLLALPTSVWQTMCGILEFTTLEKIKIEGNRFASQWQLPRCQTWTLGCHMLVENDIHAILTAAHPLDKFPSGTPLTFLTEVKTSADRTVIIELGTASEGLFSRSKAVDILLIKVADTVDKNLFQTKIQAPCTSEQSMVAIEPWFFNTEPWTDEFESGIDRVRVPVLNKKITKRGMKSGTTFGKIIAEDKLHMLMQMGGGFPTAVDAIAVSSTQVVDGEKQKFAVPGDSGSLVLEKVNPLTNNKPTAYGLVWCAMPMCSLIPGEGLDPNAVICVKVTRCLKEFVNTFKNTVMFQRVPIHLMDVELSVQHI